MHIMKLSRRRKSSRTDVYAPVFLPARHLRSIFESELVSNNKQYIAARLIHNGSCIHKDKIFVLVEVFDKLTDYFIIISEPPLRGQGMDRSCSVTVKGMKSAKGPRMQV